MEYLYIYICTHTLQIIYPLVPSIDYSTHLTKLLILKREWIIEKNPMSAVLWKQLSVKCRVQITEFRVGSSFFTLCFELICYFSSRLLGNLETVHFSLSSSSPVVSLMLFSSSSFVVSSLLVLQYGTQYLLGILFKLLLYF